MATDPTLANPSEGTPPADAKADVAALEARIDQLTAAIQASGDRDGQLASVVNNLQNQLSRIAPENQHRNDDPAAGTEEFQKFYKDIPAYIRQQAISAARDTLGPHLANQAVQQRDAMVAQARNGVDYEYGQGTWDEVIAPEVDKVMKELPLEMQASRSHFEAAVSSVLGRQYLDPDKAKNLEGKRVQNHKKREEAMNMLPTGRPRPKDPNVLEDSERRFLDSLGASGIELEESRYKAVKGVKTIDEWRATKAAAAKK